PAHPSLGPMTNRAISSISPNAYHLTQDSGCLNCRIGVRTTVALCQVTSTALPILPRAQHAVGDEVPALTENDNHPRPDAGQIGFNPHHIPTPQRWRHAAAPNWDFVRLVALAPQIQHRLN